MGTLSNAWSHITTPRILSEVLEQTKSPKKQKCANNNRLQLATHDVTGQQHTYRLLVPQTLNAVLMLDNTLACFIQVECLSPKMSKTIVFQLLKYFHTLYQLSISNLRTPNLQHFKFGLSVTALIRPSQPRKPSDNMLIPLMVTKTETK